MAPWLVKSYEPWDVERYNFGFSLVKIQVISGLQAILGLGCDGTDRKIFKLYVLILAHVMKNNVKNAPSQNVDTAHPRKKVWKLVTP